MEPHDPAPLPRRDLLAAALTAAGAHALAPSAVAAKRSVHPTGALAGVLAQQTRPVRVLFQGDSITDAHRSREGEPRPNDPAQLGGGYAWLSAAGLLSIHPDLQLEFHNRGISGNKVHQLAERWDADCLELKPDVVSVLIGVNDIWHQRAGKYDGTVEIYERDYDALLKRTREALPEVRLVVCEPFVLRCGAVDDSWFPDFDLFRAAARRVALAHDANWVGFHGMFENASKIAPPETWAADGVHPTLAGSALMAQAWTTTTLG